MIIGVHHAQVNVPSDKLAEARDFYIGVLGIKEIHRPDVFTSKGIWLNAGPFELHIGVEDNLERKTRAHLAYQVTDIAKWRDRLERAGVTITDSVAIPGLERFEFRDPFGNRVELIQPVG